MGTILGAVIGILAYFPDFAGPWGTAIKGIVTVAISMGAVMLLLPRMVALLMEGLIPLSDAAQEWIKARYPDRELNIGLDAAILVGYPANMSVAIILVPITLLLGVVMSYAGLNQMLPFTDLADTPFFAVWATTWCRGNIARGSVIGTFFVACMLTIGTFMAPATTVLAHQANFTIPQSQPDLLDRLRRPPHSVFLRILLRIRAGEGVRHRVHHLQHLPADRLGDLLRRVLRPHPARRQAGHGGP